MRVPRRRRRDRAGGRASQVAGRRGDAGGARRARERIGRIGRGMSRLGIGDRIARLGRVALSGIAALERRTEAQRARLAAALSRADRWLRPRVEAWARRIRRAALATWRTVVPPVLAVARALGRALRFAERQLTPRRAVALALLAAIALLAASQFIDYRDVGIGAEDYDGFEGIAPAPAVDTDTPRGAHGYAILPIAALALVALGLAVRGRWRLGRAIALLGAIAGAIVLLVDMPAGLDAGILARQFEGAQARLIGGFWVELAAAVTLLVGGWLLARYSYREGARTSRSGARRGRRRRERRASGRGRGARAQGAGA